MRLPATALLFRDEGMMVATVDDSQPCRLKPIDIGTDLGNAVEVDTGLGPSDRVIDNPPDSHSRRRSGQAVAGTGNRRHRHERSVIACDASHDGSAACLALALLAGCNKKAAADAASAGL